MYLGILELMRPLQREKLLIRLTCVIRRVAGQRSEVNETSIYVKLSIDYGCLMTESPAKICHGIPLSERRT
jgi:hypothetical protein